LFQKYLFDENEFLSPFGFRSLSKVHQTPFLFHGIRLEYAPGESTSNMFGGNSNWRGCLKECFVFASLILCARRSIVVSDELFDH
jgi:hypothetical protein